MPAVSVLYEDNHLLIVDKPSGIATMGAESDQATMHAQCCDYLRVKYAKPGRVYLGVVSRLDKWTSGVLPFARTSKAAARINAQMQQGRIEKIYYALVAGMPADEGVMEDWIYKDDAAHRMRIGTEGQGATARLRWQTLASADDCSLLRIVLETGRKHQIRVQCAHRGFPIIGDTKYGGPGTRGLFGLHCCRVALEHPTKKETLTFTTPVPRPWHTTGLPRSAFEGAP